MIVEKPNRYSRQWLIPGWNQEIQTKLSHAQVLLIGAGGLGCATASYLAAAGIGLLTIMDPDHVEISNLNRQVFYSESDIGKPKVHIAGKRLNEINPSVTIHPLLAGLNEENAKIFIPAHDVILSCVDQYDIRVLINRISHQFSKPLVHGAVSGFRGEAALFIESPCYQCLSPLKPETTDAGIIGAMAGIIGATQALLAIKYLTGYGVSDKGWLYIMDFEITETFRTAIIKQPDCPVCGKNGSYR